MDPVYLAGVAIMAIAVLLFTVMKLKWPAFLSLLVVSVLTAIAAGIPIQDIVPTVIEGMGGTLGSVALLVGLGAMLGGIIEKTGGAEIVAEFAVRKLGKDRVGPALLIASGIVGIPIFFDVAFIILVPIVFSFAKAAGHKTPIAVGAPIAVLMVFIHNAVPPHPGVTGSSTLLNPDVIGMVMICGLILAVPMGFVIYSLSKRITSRGTWDMDPLVQRKFDSSGAAEHGGTDRTTTVRTISRPSVGAVLTMILLPIFLIAIGTVGGLFVAADTTAGYVLSFIGAPAFALIVAVLLAMYVLGVRHGWGRAGISEVMDNALAPAAIVVFVTGAGGVFAKVLTVSGIGESVSDLMTDAGIPIIFLAFLLALIFKVAQGSGTVATLSAAGLVQASVAAGNYSAFEVTLIVLAIAMGSLSLSHINDSGFWITTKFLGMSVKGGLKTWTVLCTVAGFSSMAIITVAWYVVQMLG